MAWSFNMLPRILLLRERGRQAQWLCASVRFRGSELLRVGPPLLRERGRQAKGVLHFSTVPRSEVLRAGVRQAEWIGAS
eukprot:5971773-Heterocapsa_arctica.AAC.1